jgi:hypothetical protein
VKNGGGLPQASGEGVFISMIRLRLMDVATLTC